MIKRLLNKVVDSIAATDSGDAGDEQRDHALKLATAVLMVDVARADHEFDEAEFEHVLDLARAHFGLTPDEAAELVNAASDKAEDLVEVHEFTKLLHEHLDDDDKARIIAMLWQIAYVDGELDKYEDALVLKISDLLYVSRGLVMRLKHEAAKAAG